jgi:hypothetical protein
LIPAKPPIFVWNVPLRMSIPFCSVPISVTVFCSVILSGFPLVLLLQRRRYRNSCILCGSLMHNNASYGINVLRIYTLVVSLTCITTLLVTPCSLILVHLIPVLCVPMPCPISKLVTSTILVRSQCWQGISVDFGFVVQQSSDISHFNCYVGLDGQM